MIFYWLIRAVLFVKWLFSPPRPETVKRIDPNAKCPWCGNASGRLRAVHRTQGANTVSTPLVEHTCAVCRGRTYEAPVITAGPEKLIPSLPESSVESNDDARFAPIRKPEKEGMRRVG